jgi:hypothetical protein
MCLQSMYVLLSRSLARAVDGTASTNDTHASQAQLELFCTHGEVLFKVCGQ